VKRIGSAILALFFVVAPAAAKVLQKTNAISRDEQVPAVHKLQTGDYELVLTLNQRRAVDAFLSKNPSIRLVTSNIANLTPTGLQSVREQIAASMKSGEMQFPFASWHDFNKDGRLDIALVFASKSIVNSYKWREWRIVVFEGSSSGTYNPIVVTTFQGGCLDGLTYRKASNSVQFSCFDVAGGSFRWNGHAYDVTPMRGD
jgi:hypothetical protein